MGQGGLSRNRPEGTGIVSWGDGVEPLLKRPANTGSRLLAASSALGFAFQVSSW